MHGPQRRVSDGAPSSSTHARWRWLLDAVGAADPLVAAGLLNDAVERTATTPSDLTLRFGDEVAMPVAAVTGQRSMRRYRKRKAALRERATTSGEPAAILFAADKIAKVRQYSQQLEAIGARVRASSTATPPPLHREPALARSRHPTPSAGPYAAPRALAADPAAGPPRGRDRVTDRKRCRPLNRLVGLPCRRECDATPPQQPNAPPPPINRSIRRSTCPAPVARSRRRRPYPDRPRSAQDRRHVGASQPSPDRRPRRLPRSIRSPAPALAR